jgi:hypothetical protein
VSKLPHVLSTSITTEKTTVSLTQTNFAMLLPNCGTKTPLLVENVLNACKLSISGVEIPADAILILRFSSSDPTPSTRSLVNQNNASTLLPAMPLPGMTALTIATIAQLQLLV